CAGVGGLEGREAGGLPFGLVRGVAAGGHEPQYPARRVGPGGTEGRPGPIDQPGAGGRDQHVVRCPVRVGEYRAGEGRCRFWVINVVLPAVLGPLSAALAKFSAPFPDCQATKTTSR